MTAIQLANNKEFSELKNCLGLKTNKVYKDVKELRYGSIAIMSDSDLDGVRKKSTVPSVIIKFGYFVKNLCNWFDLRCLY